MTPEWENELFAVTAASRRPPKRCPVCAGLVQPGHRRTCLRPQCGQQWCWRPGRGRRRVWCSDNCRKMAHAARLRAAKVKA
jgi:hypothetical protein